MPISYSIDINFNIAIPNFVGIANINSIGNYIKAWNKADGKGVNNNSWGSAGNNKDNNNKEDISGVKI